MMGVVIAATGKVASGMEGDAADGQTGASAGASSQPPGAQGDETLLVANASEAAPSGTSGAARSPGAQRPARRERWARRGRWAARLALVIVLLAGATLSLTPMGRSATRAALLFSPVIGADQSSVLTATGDPVRHTTEQFTTASDTVYLDIYAPTTPAPLVPQGREGVIVIAGVGDNQQAPELVNLSEAMARSGLVVMDMTTDVLENFTISPVDTEAVVQTFLRLARWPGVDPHAIGFLGLSGGGALACLSVVDPRINDQVAFVTLFGSYYDATTMLGDMGRRALLVDGHYQPWQPISAPFDVPEYVLAHAVASTLPPDQSSLILGAFSQGGAPLGPSDLATLSPAARAAYHLLLGDEPTQVAANIAALSPAMRTLLRQVSPSAFVSQIHAPIYLLHDRSDQYVPFTESRDFAAELTRLGHPHDFVEFSIFSHVQIRPDLGLGPLVTDGARLYRILYKILLPAS